MSMSVLTSTEGWQVLCFLVTCSGVKNFPEVIYLLKLNIFIYLLDFGGVLCLYFLICIWGACSSD